MTDEEFVFRSDIRERRAAGRGDYHRKRGGGRYVRLPCDNLTRKEWMAMNGETKTYRPKELMTWEQFRAMPEDLQKEHLQWLVDNGGGPARIAELYGCSQQNISVWCNRLGVKIPLRGRTPSSIADRFDAFLACGGKIGGAGALQTREEGNLSAEGEKPVEAVKIASAPGALRLCGEAGMVLQKAFELIGSGRYEISVEWRPL